MLFGHIFLIFFSIIVAGCFQTSEKQGKQTQKNQVEIVSLDQAINDIQTKSPNAALKINQLIERIGFGSCMSQHEPQPVWAAIRNEHLDLFLGLGDLVYASKPEEKPMRFAYLKQIEKNPDLVEFRRQVPWLGIWDDHDFGINDGGGDHPDFEEAKKLLLAFLPNSAKVLSPSQKAIYHSVILGNKPRTLHIIFLDTRTHRSPLVPHPQAHAKLRYAPNLDPQARILSEEQWLWLEQEFMRPANVRLLISSIQVLPEQHGFEKWSNIPKERERLLKLIEKYKLKNLVILSGDRHFSEVSKLQLNKKHTLYEITSSGLNRESNLFDEKNPLRVGHSAYFKSNYGVIHINYGKRELEYQTKDVSGNEVYRLRIPLR